MTTTAIDTNTVNTVGDGFDLVANGDVLFVTPGVSLGSVEAAGVFADSGGYVFNDGDIFAINEGILLNADSNTGQFSEVWIASQGVVQSASGFGIAVEGGTSTILNYGAVTGDFAVTTAEPATLVNYGTMSGQDGGVLDKDFVPGDEFYLQNYGSIVSSAGDAFDGSESEAIETILNSGTISGASSSKQQR